MKEVFELDGVKATMAENIDEGAPSACSLRGDWKGSSCNLVHFMHI